MFFRNTLKRELQRMRDFFHFRELFTHSFITPLMKHSPIRIYGNGEVYAVSYFDKKVV
jgi:hypothetical protein